MSHIGPGALVVGFLVTVLPFSFLLRLLQQLPTPLVRSHRRWHFILNGLIVLSVGTAIVLFLHRSSDPERRVAAIALEFVIASVVYGFGLSLVLRQFCGVYEEFIITVSMGGLALQKTSYANIVNAESEEHESGETAIHIETSRGARLKLILPTREVERFYKHVRKKRSVE